MGAFHMLAHTGDSLVPLATHLRMIAFYGENLRDFLPPGEDPNES